MDGRKKFIAFLLTARVFASLGLLAVVVAGALGFGDSIKLAAGAGGIVLAAALKATHTLA